MADHEHTSDIDWADAVGDLERSDDVLQPISEAVMSWLGVTEGSQVADIGCGAGGMTALLANAVGRSGTVYAVDSERTLLDTAVERGRQLGYGDRIRAYRHDLSTGVPELSRLLDLAWAAGVIHHLPDQQAAIERLSDLLIDGGRLALSEGGLKTAMLPWDVGVGDPGLEGRLHAAEEAWFVRMRASIPGSKRAPHGWPVLLRRAGLTNVQSRSFLMDRPSPISALVAGYVLGSLSRRVERAEDSLTQDDLASWRRLLDPEDSAYLGTRDDLYCLTAITVHVGTKQLED